MKTKLSIKLELQNGKKEKSIDLNIHKENKFLLNSDSSIMDLHLIGTTVFEIEKFISPESKFYNAKIKKITLPITTELNQDDKQQLNNLLNQLFLFLYKKDLTFTFEHVKYDAKTNDDSNLDLKYDSVMLFSGGLDSSIGLDYCKSKFNNTLLVYERHGNAGQLTPLITKLENSLIKPKGMNLIRVAGPKQISGHFANTRGLLYLLTGSLFTSKNNSPLIISECGVTMYQPRFGPLYQVTYTTHPLIVQIGKEIVRIITKKEIEIQFPFENNTKAEMIKQYGNDDNIANSFSCLSNLRYVKAKGNCGDCYACLVRRLGILAARNDPTKYSEKNKLADIKHIKEKLYPIISFCYRAITDFDGLDYWQKERIIKYQKKELFQRFALDTFIALENISKTEKLPDWAEQFLKGIDKNLISERKKQLRK